MRNDRIENAIIVKSKTRLEQLTARFNTKAQAKFYISQNQMQFAAKKARNNEIAQSLESNADIGQLAAQELQVQNVQNQAAPDFVPAPERMQSAQNANVRKPRKPGNRPNTRQIARTPANPAAGDFGDYEAEHEIFHSVLDEVLHEASTLLKTKVVDREFLPSYIFTDKDLVIVIGQDGLVANTAKYVNGLPIIAINPDPGRFDGVLLPFREVDALAAIEAVLSGAYRYTDVTMARASLEDGQTLLAFNDLFIGIRTHGSARYRITYAGDSENHSSSGIIVSTGAGSTGWLSSVYNMAKGINRFLAGSEVISVEPVPRDRRELVFVVREPFASRTSQANLSCGVIGPGSELVIESYMPEDGVIFSDGVFTDYIAFNSGAIATVSVAAEKARLVQK